MNKIHHINHKINFIKKHSPKEFHDIIRRICFERFAFNINDRYDFLNDKQIGGRVSKELIQEYKGYKFRIHIEKQDDITINILTHNVNPLFCGIIDINKKGKVAALINISSYKNCTIPDLINKGGSIILNFIIGFLKLNKNSLGINRIVLRDNSTKFCNKCPEQINMAMMYTLLYGDTWYGKYGFRPYDTMQNKPYQPHVDSYNKNKNIIQNAKVIDVNLIKYFKDAVKLFKLTDINTEHFDKLFIVWKDKPLSQILRVLLKDYDKYCCIFTYISKKIYDELGLFPFSELPFYLDI